MKTTNSNWQVGGVFPLEDIAHVSCDSETVLAHWCELGKLVGLFRNGRSAIAFIVKDLRSKRVWLPAYVCHELGSLFQAFDVDVQFFRVDRSLKPDLEQLKSFVGAGDVVLFVNYFGKPPGDQLRDLIELRRDVHWIEDCSQTISYQGGGVGDYLVFSARKVMGVPDGGVLVDRRGDLSRPLLVARDACELTRPYRTRSSPDTRHRNDIWYPEFKKAEQGMVCGDIAISDTSLARLSTSGLSAITKNRVENYVTLFLELKQHALFASEPDGWIPFGFPMLTKNPAGMQQFLADRGVFAARHWPVLVAPYEKFRDAHFISANLITIPCDQRYDSNDMREVAQIVRGAIL